MSDLIDRQAALKEAKEIAAYHWDFKVVTHKFVDSLEKLAPADLWIPCKERLPGDDMRVLVDDGRQIEVMKWDLMRGCFYDNHAHDYDRSEILAWMPLPEPYKEKENEQT